MPPIPSENWPKGWLLQIHAQAIEHGFVFIEPISASSAVSLKARLYRLRRRSDKSNAAFIPPEYHMVTVGAWVEYPDERAPMGRLPVIYNRLPDGEALPQIMPVDQETYEIVTAPRITIDPVGYPLTISKPIPISTKDLTMDESQVEGYVAEMLRRVQEGRDDDDS